MVLLPMKAFLPKIVCADGFTFSAQASEFHYSIPKARVGPYSHVEVGYPNRREELFMPYAEPMDNRKARPVVYGYVPIEVVHKAIKKHGGMVSPLISLQELFS